MNIWFAIQLTIWLMIQSSIFSPDDSMVRKVIKVCMDVISLFFLWMRTQEAERYKTLQLSAEIQLHCILLQQNDQHVQCRWKSQDCALQKGPLKALAWGMSFSGAVNSGLKWHPKIKQCKDNSAKIILIAFIREKEQSCLWGGKVE